MPDLDLDAIATHATAVRDISAERDRYRRALERIAKLDGADDVEVGAAGDIFCADCWAPEIAVVALRAEPSSPTAGSSTSSPADARITAHEERLADLDRQDNVLAGALLPFVTTRQAATHYIQTLRHALQAWLDARAETPTAPGGLDG